MTAWLIAAPPTISQPNSLGRLVEMKTTLPVLSRTFYLVYSNNKVMSARLTSFLDFCRGWQA